MTEPNSARELAPEQEAVLQDIVRQLGIEIDKLEILTLDRNYWPDALNIYYVLRKDRHGRVFYHYACYEGELYSPFAPDGLERLLKRLLASRRFDLSAEQIVNLVLMYERPEPMMTFVTDMKRDLAPDTRAALDHDYELTDIAPELIQLDEEDYKLIFWTLNLRREIIKRWIAYINTSGRMRLMEDVMIELRDARERQNPS
jgi:hypothetical protein